MVLHRPVELARIPGNLGASLYSERRPTSLRSVLRQRNATAHPTQEGLVELRLLPLKRWLGWIQ
jgi:hypothetical protein